jgi:hypothetical protein
MASMRSATAGQSSIAAAACQLSASGMALSNAWALPPAGLSACTAPTHSALKAEATSRQTLANTTHARRAGTKHLPGMSVRHGNTCRTTRRNVPKMPRSAQLGALAAPSRGRCRCSFSAPFRRGPLAAARENLCARKFPCAVAPLPGREHGLRSDPALGRGGSGLSVSDALIAAAAAVAACRRSPLSGCPARHISGAASGGARTMAPWSAPSIACSSRSGDCSGC